jgi:hypothetical protein
MTKTGWGGRGRKEAIIHAETSCQRKIEKHYRAWLDLQIGIMKPAINITS